MLTTGQADLHIGIPNIVYHRYIFPKITDRFPANPRFHGSIFILTNLILWNSWNNQEFCIVYALTNTQYHSFCMVGRISLASASVHRNTASSVPIQEEYSRQCDLPMRVKRAPKKKYRGGAKRKTKERIFKFAPSFSYIFLILPFYNIIL